MLKKNNEKIRVKATVVKPSKRGWKAHFRKAHLRHTKTKFPATKRYQNTEPENPPLDLATLNYDLTSSKYQKEIKLLLEDLQRIVATGQLPPSKRKWKAGYGPVHRIGKDPVTSRTAHNPNPPSTFSVDDIAILNRATNNIQEQHLDHVVPSTWGTITDWIEAGTLVDPKQIGNGITLTTSHNKQNKITVYHATQTIDYQPFETEKPLHTNPALQTSIKALHNIGIHTREHFANSYSPTLDRITIIPQHLFTDISAYIKTYAHELAHATGHPQRLNRITLTTKVQRGDPTYNQEELVAELASIIVARVLTRHYTPLNEPVYEIPRWITAKSAEYLWRHLPEPRGELAGLQDVIVEAEKAADWILERTLLQK